MALADLMKTNNKKLQANEISEEDLIKNIDKYRQLISYWRMYPDKLIDYYVSLSPSHPFKLYFYQRLFLRVAMRHKFVYATFVRAWSKSFMSVMTLMLKAILYPGAKLFSVAAGKEQSAQILSSKVDEICSLIPAIEREIIWDTRGMRQKTHQTKDTVIYTFKNGSVLRNISATIKTRGGRFHSGLMEECVQIDQDILKEVIIPTMNVSRNIPGYGVDRNEPLNQSQIYITTAGYKNTFGYEQLIQILCQSVARPKEAMILGGTWKVPMMEGLLDRDFITNLKIDGTFNDAAFDREYNSVWTGDIESAFFESEHFDKYRDINLPEYEYSNKIAKDGYYIMGVDVGRLGCTTEVSIIKVTPVPKGIPIKQLVNFYSYEEEHFGLQAIKLKRLFNKYKCKIAVVDGNGLGVGLTDFLVTDQVDPDTGDILWNWGVYNDDDRVYKKFETPETIYHAMYIMKANQALNSEMYAYCQTQLRHGRIHFLIDENTAKNKLLSQAQGQKMSAAKRAEYLKPYTLTSVLREQMLNMIQENEGANIILKPSNKKIPHDRFSALIYGLYYCKLEEDRNHKKKGRDISKLMFFS